MGGGVRWNNDGHDDDDDVAGDRERDDKKGCNSIGFSFTAGVYAPAVSLISFESEIRGFMGVPGAVRDE